MNPTHKLAELVLTISRAVSVGTAALVKGARKSSVKVWKPLQINHYLSKIVNLYQISMHCSVQSETVWSFLHCQHNILLLLSFLMPLFVQISNTSLILDFKRLKITQEIKKHSSKSEKELPSIDIQGSIK